MLPMIPLKKHTFSNTGYRLRKNIFNMKDQIIFGTQNEKVFYDTVLYNSDTILTDQKQEVIAEMYWRVDVDKMEHSREVYTLMDYLGDVGGIPDVIMFTLMLLFGHYINFIKELSTMQSLYDDPTIANVQSDEICKLQNAEAREEHNEKDGFFNEGGADLEDALREQDEIEEMDKKEKLVEEAQRLEQLNSLNLYIDFHFNTSKALKLYFLKLFRCYNFEWCGSRCKVGKQNLSDIKKQYEQGLSQMNEDFNINLFLKSIRANQVVILENKEKIKLNSQKIG